MIDNPSCFRAKERKLKNNCNFPCEKKRSTSKKWNVDWSKRFSKNLIRYRIQSIWSWTFFLERKLIYSVRSIRTKLNWKKNNWNNGFTKMMFISVRNVKLHSAGRWEKFVQWIFIVILYFDQFSFQYRCRNCQKIFCYYCANHWKPGSTAK